MKFDNILSKARDVFENAYRKADGAFSVQRQKFDVAGLENKLSKDYEALGRLCYEEMEKGAFNGNKEFAAVAEKIKAKKTQIEEIKKDINKIKSKKRFEE